VDSIMEDTAGQGIAENKNASATMGTTQKLHFFNPTRMRNTSPSPQPNISRKLEKVDKVPGNEAGLSCLQESDGAEKEIETMEGLDTELGMLSKLDRLYLQDNKLSGAIPSEIGLLSNLQDLFLFNNRLTGSIPSEFGRLTNLRRLRLGNNSLTSSIPTEMGLLSLEVLDIP